MRRYKAQKKQMIKRLVSPNPLIQMRAAQARWMRLHASVSASVEVA
jgi:hypothetical protein